MRPECTTSGAEIVLPDAVRRQAYAFWTHPPAARGAGAGGCVRTAQPQGMSLSFRTQFAGGPMHSGRTCLQ